MLQIAGRRSSHFTRITRIFAEELQVAYEIAPIFDMTTQEPRIYADNPALKLPVLRTDDGVIFGTENICRVIAEHASRPAEIVWPEMLRSPVCRNAQELVWHCMTAQVQIVFGTVVAKLPGDNLYFDKARKGFDGALTWLDGNVASVIEELPRSRTLSLFEASLFCLVEHLQFRKTLPIENYANLMQFARGFAVRPAAQCTAYQFDVAPV
jgi:glutathione S-transferase